MPETDVGIDADLVETGSGTSSGGIASAIAISTIRMSSFIGDSATATNFVNALKKRNGLTWAESYLKI
jgi:hypothetical protein